MADDPQRSDPQGPGPVQSDDGSFFIGFRPPGKSLRRFLACVIAGLVFVFAGAGWLIAATQDDPGDGSFRYDWGRQTVTGVIEATPYPLLHVLESTDRFEEGHTLLLSGAGKRGAQSRAEPLDGQVVTVSGVALTRGSIDMIQLRGGAAGLSAAEDHPDAAPEAEPPQGVPPEAEPLGRWRVTGEICDGKCYTGAMRPGEGLAHRACANICLVGGVPPIFVSTDRIDGEEFLLLADADGGEVTDALLDHVAMLVEVEGDVERRGDILVFRIDSDSIRLAP